MKTVRMQQLQPVMIIVHVRALSIKLSDHRYAATLVYRAAGHFP